MAADPALRNASIDDFFRRCKLTSMDQTDCYTFIEALYPDTPLSPASCQGYCSMTVFVGDEVVIQFRPSIYRLDLKIADAARSVYGSFAPETKYIGFSKSGLLVYIMNRIVGVTVKQFRDRRPSIELRTSLCVDFARFISRGWQNRCESEVQLGAIGSSIKSRLKSLSIDLPLRFQSAAKNILMQLHRVEALPWVLSHGDIIASNIMVYPSSGNLSGFVDWAEAEYLPFGICLYGLEELLGEMGSLGFMYYPHANELRDSFWAELLKCIPELRQNAILEAVKWHGIAFDDGSISRVVQEGRDVDEIRRLDAFLDLEERDSSRRQVYKRDSRQMRFP